jgi:hypothetical protein
LPTKLFVLRVRSLILSLHLITDHGAGERAERAADCGTTCGVTGGVADQRARSRAQGTATEGARLTLRQAA